MKGDTYCIKYGKQKIIIRKDIIDDYWVFEGLLFAD